MSAAGVLKFQLGLESNQFQNAIAGADKSTLQLIGDMNRAGAASTVMAGGLTQGFRKAKESIKGTKELLRAFGDSAEMLGYSTFPGLTAAIRVSMDSIKGLMSLTKASEMGFSGLSVVLVGLAAAVATLVEAWQELKAEFGLVDSTEALDKQYEALKERLIPQLEKAMKIGRLDFKTAQGAINFLNGASDENRGRAVKNAQDALRPIMKEDQQAPFANSLNQMMTGLSHQFLLSGPAREKALFSDEMDQQLREALDLAKKGGKPEQPIVDQFNKMKEAKYKEIDDAAEKKKEKEKPDDRFPSLRPKEYSQFEKMGFVFGKANHGSKDHAAEMARDTRQMVALLKKLTGQTPRENPFGGGNFGYT